MYMYIPSFLDFLSIYVTIQINFLDTMFFMTA